MKISHCVAIVLSAVALSCSKGSADEQGRSSGLNIVELRSVGKKVANPAIHADNLKPEGAEETLLSLRYVDPLPIYYMDYTAKVGWDELIKDPGHRYQLNDVASLMNDIDGLLYKESPKVEPAKSSGACSGFVCNNPENELLFCRNYDGNTNPLVVVFNKEVGPGEHKSVIMTDLLFAQLHFGQYREYAYDSCLLEKDRNLDVLLRQPISVMDGMNDAGLCMAAYQLPNFQRDDQPITDPDSNIVPRPYGVDQNTGKQQITASLLNRLILTRCSTVDDVIKLFESFDYTTTISDTNIHWFVADADNNFRTLEFWKGSDGRDSLYVMDEHYRLESSYLSISDIPFEYRSIENYYCNKDAARTYRYDYWQHGYSAKTRISRMMNHYSPVMTEEDALRCLQNGTYGAEEPGDVTDWSCVYNPRKRTMIFNMRNNLSTVYSIDLAKDLDCSALR